MDVRAAFTLPAANEVTTSSPPERAAFAWSVLCAAMLSTSGLVSGWLEPRIVALIVYLVARAGLCAASPAESVPLQRGVWFVHCMAVPLNVSGLAAPVFWNSPSVWVNRVLALLVAWQDDVWFRTHLLWPHVVWSLVWVAVESSVAVTSFQVHPALCVLSASVLVIVYGTINAFDAYKNRNCKVLVLLLDSPSST